MKQSGQKTFSTHLYRAEEALLLVAQNRSLVFTSGCKGKSAPCAGGKDVLRTSAAHPTAGQHWIGLGCAQKHVLQKLRVAQTQFPHLEEEMVPCYCGYTIQ